jgi:hypothetical protein
MKNKLFLFVLLLFSIIIACCNKDNDKKEPVPGIWIKFEGILDSDMAQAWIIETARNDTATHIDTIEYGQLSHINAYTITLDFKSDTENGDYLIIADSIKQINIISNVEVRFEDGIYKFTFLFNGIPKNSANKEDVFLTITR